MFFSSVTLILLAVEQQLTVGIEESLIFLSLSLGFRSPYLLQTSPVMPLLFPDVKQLIGLLFVTDNKCIENQFAEKCWKIKYEAGFCLTGFYYWYNVKICVT